MDPYYFCKRLKCWYSWMCFQCFGVRDPILSFRNHGHTGSHSQGRLLVPKLLLTTPNIHPDPSVPDRYVGLTSSSSSSSPLLLFASPFFSLFLLWIFFSTWIHHILELFIALQEKVLPLKHVPASTKSAVCGRNGMSGIAEYYQKHRYCW